MQTQKSEQEHTIGHKVNHKIDEGKEHNIRGAEHMRKRCTQSTK